MIERYDPFGRVLSLRQMVDRLMEEALVMPRGSAGQTIGAGGPAMDVYEEGDNLIVETQLPGIKPEDIDINIEHGTLTIRGQTKTEQERKERNYLVREHHSGSFSRSLRLPEPIDPEACQATYENGVLRLPLPKSEAAKPRRIAITSGGESGGRESLSSSAGAGGTSGGAAGPSGTGATSAAGGPGETGGAAGGTGPSRSGRPRGTKASGGGASKGTASTGTRRGGKRSGGARPAGS